MWKGKDPKLFKKLQYILIFEIWQISKLNQQGRLYPRANWILIFANYEMDIHFFPFAKRNHSVEVLFLPPPSSYRGAYSWSKVGFRHFGKTGRKEPWKTALRVTPCGFVTLLFFFFFSCAHVGKNRHAASFSVVFWRAKKFLILRKSNISVFFFLFMLFVLCFRNLCQSKACEIFLLYFLQEVL